MMERQLAGVIRNSEFWIANTRMVFVEYGNLPPSLWIEFLGFVKIPNHPENIYEVYVLIPVKLVDVF